MENIEMEKSKNVSMSLKSDRKYRKLMRYAHDIEVVSRLFIILAIIGGIIAALQAPLFLVPIAGIILQTIVLFAIAKVIRILAEKD